MTTEKKESASVKANYLIQVDVRRVKGETAEGKKYDFLTYTAYDKRGKISKLKFTRDAQNVPQAEGCFTLEIEPKNINRDKTTRYNEYWVKDVVKFTIYDGFTENTEDLPF